MDRSLSPREAAEKLGISPDTLRRWERDGLIACERTPGGQRRYREEDVSSLLAGDESERDRGMIALAPSASSPTREPHARTATPDLAPWERRVSEERAELEVTKIRTERSALIRAERAASEERERVATDARRAAAERAAKLARMAEFDAVEEARLNELRAYGKVCAIWAPQEYQAKVVRDLLVTVNRQDYPPDLPDYLARVQVTSRVETVLKPWRDDQARQREEVESRRKMDSLILSGQLHAQAETRTWDRRAAERAIREVDRELRDEVEADWTTDEVRDLVDDVLDEWFEE